MVEVEESHIVREAVERLVQAPGVRVGDQDLPKAPTAEQAQQVAHALGVDLVEDVVTSGPACGLSALR